MIRTSLIGLASLFALTFNAHALSCMRPDPVQTVHWQQEAGKTPVVAVGKISIFHGSLEPEVKQNPNERVGTEAHGYFSGKLYGPNDVLEIHNLYVKVIVDCAGPWCGGGPINGPLLILGTEDSGGDSIHTLSHGPCGGSIFPLPADGDLSDIQKQLADPTYYNRMPQNISRR